MAFSRSLFLLAVGQSRAAEMSKHPPRAMQIKQVSSSELAFVSSSLPSVQARPPLSAPRLGVSGRHRQPGTRSHQYGSAYRGCSVKLSPCSNRAPGQNSKLIKKLKDAKPTRRCCCKLGSKQASSLICSCPYAQQPFSPSNGPCSLQALRTQGLQQRCSVCLHLCG